MDGRALVHGRTNLPHEQSNSSLQRAWNDRLMLSEATKLAGDLMGQFPNLREVSDGFTGTLAATLMAYPRSVVFKITTPVTGIAAKCKFLSISEVVAWCEHESDTLRSVVDWETRAARTRRETQEWLDAPKIQSLLEKTKAWLDRSDPKAAELAGISPEQLAEREAATAAANAKALADSRARVEAEWQRTGYQAPTIAGVPISRELAGMLNVQGRREEAA